MTRSDLPDPADVKFIKVAVSPKSVENIQLLMANEQIDLTEAVRRLLDYGGFVYRSVKVDGEELLLRNGNVTREVVLIR
jgi:hypothetical protein